MPPEVVCPFLYDPPGSLPLRGAVGPFELNKWAFIERLGFSRIPNQLSRYLLAIRQEGRSAR